MGITIQLGHQHTRMNLYNTSLRMGVKQIFHFFGGGGGPVCVRDTKSMCLHVLCLLSGQGPSVDLEND